MSGFSLVDGAANPQRLVAILDEAAVGLAAMKAYMAMTHRLSGSAAPVLNVGCGAGHDLAALRALDVGGVGVDPSTTMLAAAAGRAGAPLVLADGGRLPFRSNSFGGCWIERVLIHVADPALVVAEAARCVEPGGIFTVFEPDWSSVRVVGANVPVEWITSVRHPGAGSAAGELLEGAGCSILDRVEERSWWTFDAFEKLAGLDRSVDRAVRTGTGSREQVAAWIADLRQREAHGEFRAEIAKVLWVAQKQNAA